MVGILGGGCDNGVVWLKLICADMENGGDGLKK